MDTPTSAQSRSIKIVSIVAVAALGFSTAACSSSSESSSPASASSSSVQLDDQTKTQLQNVLESVRTSYGFPGVQAGVWTEGDSWTGTSGVAKQGTSQAIAAADHTRIGSITKTMTGTVVLQLVEAGSLSMDDVIDKYVPGMPNGSTATIKNLLEMQSGIPTYTAEVSILNKYSKDPTTTFTPQQLVNSVKGKKPSFAPGTEFFYSNTNSVLLGMVIEQVTGESISANFQDRLFGPLGMNSSSVPAESLEIPAPFLSGVSDQADPEGVVKNATNWSPTLAFTAGEVISTLDDLRKWGQALGTGDGILNADTQQTREESVNTTVPPNQPSRSYGMGIVNTAGWLGHTGEIPGYNTVVNFDPVSRTTIVVMVNSDIAKGDPATAPAVAVFDGFLAVLEGSSGASATASS
ncbi:MAG: beta-lactamase family protein [Actinobacteria bacterium]|nr:beta-lactamase family protein [Actinomycetota bacterium]